MPPPRVRFSASKFLVSCESRYIRRCSARAALRLVNVEYRGGKTGRGQSTLTAIPQSRGGVFGAAFNPYGGASCSPSPTSLCPEPDVSTIALSAVHSD